MTSPATYTSNGHSNSAPTNNLAVSLSDLGQYNQARLLQEDTLARRRRVQGADHPDTLEIADGLAADLRKLGDHQAAPDSLARTPDDDTAA